MNTYTTYVEKKHKSNRNIENDFNKNILINESVSKYYYFEMKKETDI